MLVVCIEMCEFAFLGFGSRGLDLCWMESSSFKNVRESNGKGGKGS